MKRAQGVPGDCLIPVPTAAHQLNRPIDSVRRDVIAGRLEGERRGARWYVSRTDLERAVAEREKASAEQ